MERRDGMREDWVGREGILFGDRRERGPEKG